MYNSQDQKALQGLSAYFLKEAKAADMAAIRQVIRYHDWRYYVLNEPILSDLEYDSLFKILVNLETQNPTLITSDSPTQRVAIGLSNDFDSVNHLVSMLSLENSYNLADITEFENSVKKFVQNESVTFCVEPKFDGASIALVYENDQLIRAATRGDGTVGEEITNNAKALKSIPLSAPFSKFGIHKIELRGEVVIRNSVFEEMNKSRREAGLKTFQNPRNTAAGSLRMKDPKEVAERGLEAVLYHISFAENKEGENMLGKTLIFHFNNIELLHQCGFQTPLQDLKICETPAEIDAFLQTWETKRNTFVIDTDGMVIKVNSLHQQLQCGSTSHHPRWAIAYKFPAKRAHSKLLKVEFQVGRTGAITPVAKIEPVSLAGVTISSISLHNADFISEKDIQLNDTVVVERAGEVIPYIVGPLLDLRDGTQQIISFPTVCPSCNEALVRVEEEVAWRCENIECQAQTEERMIHYVSKDAMDIDGLGRSIIIDFIEKGFVKTLDDIYKLPFAEIQKLEGWGEKSIQNLKEGIEKSKDKPIWRLLNSLGIRHVGVTTAKDISKHLQQIFDLTNFDLERLENIEGIGPKVAKSISSFFEHEGNIHLLKQLESHGVNMENRPQDMLSKNDLLKGKTFLFTGSLKEFTRDRAKQLVEENGGTLVSGVSAKLNFLVVGEDAGSKLTKAKAIDSIQILTERAFLEMIES